MTDCSAGPLRPEGADTPGDPQRPTRASRIEVEALVMLNGADGVIEARACDVSENGLKVEMAEPHAPGPVTVKLPGFPIFSGEIRWRGARHIGIELFRPIPLDFLTTWVKTHGFSRKGK
jgi:hypothetical protein